MGRARPLIVLACLLSGSLAHADTPSPTTTPTGGALASADDARRKQVIAHGEGVDVTVGQVEDMIARQAPSMRAKFDNPDELKTVVNNLVRAELLANEAERRGYQAQASVRYLTKDSAAQALVRSEIDDKITPEAIAEDDVSAYYEAHPAEFHRVAMRRASQIVLDGEEQAAQLLPEAEKADARAFAELAKQRSKDPETKVQGGDLGYFASEPENDPPRDKTQPGVLLPVRRAVFALAEVGETSKQLTELGAQRAIVRFTAERPERHVSLGDAELSIRAKLWRERRQQALDRLQEKLRNKDKPQVFTERIYLIDFDDMEKRPSGFVPEPVLPKATLPNPASAPKPTHEPAAQHAP